MFVHGAGFVSGNANMYDGARLLNKDIVLITFNYRLGVFGKPVFIKKIFARMTD